MASNPTTSEASLRRRAKAAGYQIVKSRRRNIDCNNYGEYMIVDMDLNACVCGSSFDADLQEVAEFVRMYC